MALADNSYGSVAEVEALTRVYLHGSAAYSTTTKPTLAEVEKFIDRCSGVLNVALANAGFSVPVTQADAVLACDNWVVLRAKAFVELAQPYAGLDENPTDDMLGDLESDAVTFVKMSMAGFGALGVGQAASDSNAVIFTGMTVQADRVDPLDTSIEQPKFSRGQFRS